MERYKLLIDIAFHSKRYDSGHVKSISTLLRLLIDRIHGGSWSRTPVSPKSCMTRVLSFLLGRPQSLRIFEGLILRTLICINANDLRRKMQSVQSTGMCKCIFLQE